MDKAELLKKYKPDDDLALKAFVQKGFVIYEGVHDPKLIKDSREFFFEKYNILHGKSQNGEIPVDVNGWAVAIIEKYLHTELGEKFIESPGMMEIMKKYLGPDVVVFNQDALWINVPKDKDPVLLKGLHTDAWTGTSVYTIFSKTFFTDVDQYNGMSVCPESHLLGMVPVRNRAIDPSANVQLEVLNLDNVKAGDVAIWHPLLVHSTTGHSDKNMRVSLTQRFTSAESPFSSQERSLGYRCLSVGPLNQVLRLIGNDYLTPLRTYGGFVGVDRRLEKLYGYSDYKVKEDYSKYL